MTARAGMITLHEAAERLGVHYMTAYKYVRTGRLPAVKEGVEWRIDPADVATLEERPKGRSRRGKARADAWRSLQNRLVAGDEAGAWAVVEAALASGADPTDISMELLVPAMRRVGDLWERGELTVADEHRAAAVAHRLVGRLGPRFVHRGRRRGTVIVGGPSDELHGLPIAICADLLRFARFDVVDLGPNTPAESFVDAAADLDRLVAISICLTTRVGEPGLREAIAALASAGTGVPVLVGGAAIDDEEHARRLGADGYTGPDATAVIDAVEAILGGDPAVDAASSA